MSSELVVAPTAGLLAKVEAAERVLMPVSARNQLNDLSDDMAARIDIQFYADAKDALLKALVE